VRVYTADTRAQLVLVVESTDPSVTPIPLWERREVQALIRAI
jgi:hypothetical protein